MSEKCIKCEKWLRKVKGPCKVITDKDDLVYLSSVLGKAVTVNSVLCSRCRLVLYKKPRQALTEVQNIDSDKEDPSYMPSTSTSGSSVAEEFVELPIQRLVATHKYCCICGVGKDITVVPKTARVQCYVKKNIYVPKGNRCCKHHLIKDRFYEDDIIHLRPFANYSSIPKSDLCTILSSISTGSTLNSATLSEKQLFIFTGLTWENIYELETMLLSLRDSSTRSVVQAIIVFLFKLRSGNSNQVIASILGLEHPQFVSEYMSSVINSFEKDVLPYNFGIDSTTRNTILSHTSEIAKDLFDVQDDQAIIICDGTYIRHQKSLNNIYQKKSFSGQKKVPLCKPFTVCTTDGYIIDMLGPFNANLNDATIMKDILRDPNGLTKLLKPGDIIVVDRGFRDIVPELERRNLTVLIPAMKGSRQQLPVSEANRSRLVTKIRWPVEAVHGIIKQKYHLLDQKVDNKLLPKIGTLCRIASFLNNKYGNRLVSDVGMKEKIVERLKAKANEQTNTLFQEVEANRWLQRKVTFKSLSSNDLLDFPEMDETELKIFFGGTYQLSQSVCYLAELLNSDGSINIEFSRDVENILRVHIKSRHVGKKTYHIFIDYEPNQNRSDGIKRHYCTCPNGNRTVGSCSHIAAVVYYLSNARFKSRIVKPAEILTNIFDCPEVCPVIDEDSDED